MSNHELNAQEVEYLEKLLARRNAELLHELHHAVTLEYRAGLKREIELTERVMARLTVPVTTEVSVL